MWLYESEQYIKLLEENLPRKAKTALDIGSEGEEYRNIRQPWIKNLYNYLQNRGVVISTMDLDQESKATIIQDITQPIEKLGNFDLVMATHLLEHVPKELIPIVITNIELLVKKGGLLIVSVPYKYPYHERPIDNMWRPTWQELNDIFNGKLLFGETVAVEHALPQYINEPKCQVSYVLLQY